jgi:hypothetical protein
MKPKFLIAAAVTLASAAIVSAAFTVGGTAYTKRVETALLSEPRMLASPVSRLPYAAKLKVEETKGPWLRVSDGRNSGWIFGGNLAEAKPSETRGLDGLPVAASETNATAAARPLTEASQDYSQRHGLGNAASDLTWLNEQRTKISDEDVQAFLRSQKKGEFQ